MCPRAGPRNLVLMKTNRFSLVLQILVGRYVIGDLRTHLDWSDFHTSLVDLNCLGKKILSFYLKRRNMIKPFPNIHVFFFFETKEYDWQKKLTICFSYQTKRIHTSCFYFYMRSPICILSRAHTHKKTISSKFLYFISYISSKHKLFNSCVL